MDAWTNHTHKHTLEPPHVEQTGQCKHIVAEVHVAGKAYKTVHQRLP